MSIKPKKYVAIKNIVSKNVFFYRKGKKQIKVHIFKIPLDKGITMMYSIIVLSK